MMKIGFACAWRKRPEITWSGSAYALQNALMRRADVVDLGPEYSAVQTFYKYLHIRRRHGRWASTYRWSSSRDMMIERKLRSSLREASVDAVIEISDLARLDVPFYPYKDLSFAVVEEYYDPIAGAPNFRGIDLDTIKYRKERQHEIWESAAGIFVMSKWAANALVERSGVPRDKVSVVYAGLNSIEATTDDHAGSETDPTGRGPANLLFVGRDFFRKGGDIAVAALARLRHEYSPDIRLTVVGPTRWPLPGGVPEGIVFLGSQTAAEVARLYRAHDLFVMPSRFEAFGIVFGEALAHGVPVIGRAAFAMPEIIEPGRNGALVHSDDPAELASAIVAVLEDPSVRLFAARTAREVRTRYSWDAVAERMLCAIADSA